MQKSSKRQAEDASQKFPAQGTQTEIVGGLKLKAAAVYLGGLSVPTMHRLVARGLLRPNRCLRHLLFPIEELNRFLRQ
jgi:Helix-turn-helix domain